MAVETLGAMWPHPDRNYYGRPTSGVELIYRQGGSLDLSIYGAKRRIALLMQRGIQRKILRIDDQPGQTLPKTNDNDALHRYLDFAFSIASDTDLKHFDAYIGGNEPNLKSEYRLTGIPLSPRWVARVLVGHGRPVDQTDNFFQYVKTANPQAEILIPPVAPYSPDNGGEFWYRPPDGRDMLSPWELYAYELYWRVINNNYHAPYQDLRFAMHMYSRVGPSGTLNGGKFEPWNDVRDGIFKAQFGSKVLKDFIHAYAQASRGNRPIGDSPIVDITEWNTFTDGEPVTNYPQGLEIEVLRMIGFTPNIKSFNVFVDQDYGGGWQQTAVTGGVGRLPIWNADHDSLFKNGW